MMIIRVFSLWAPSLAWMYAIYFLSSIPGLNSGLGIWDLILRKVAHMVEYGVLTLLLYRSIRNTWIKWTQRAVVAISSVLSFVYACSDEFHQSFVPNRGPSVTDVGFDSVGILLAVVVIFSFQAIANKRRS